MADLLVIDESDSQQLPEISREASMKVAAFSTSIQHAARSQVLARWILDHVERAA
jgi:hypothetical protein